MELDFSNTLDHDLTCPGCGVATDGLTGPSTPDEGDISVCAYCASINTFTAELTSRALTEEEIRELPEETRDVLRKLVLAVIRVNHVRTN